MSETDQTDRDTDVQGNNNMNELSDTADWVFFKGAAIVNIFKTEWNLRILIVPEIDEVKKYACQILGNHVSAAKDYFLKFYSIFI